MNAPKSEKVSVLALGNWGTAIAEHLARSGYDVLGWAIDKLVVDSVNSSHINPLAMQQAKLHSNLKATLDLEEALSRPIVVMSFPSTALAELMPKIGKSSAKILISALKGMDSESLLTPLQLAAKYCKPDLKTVVLSGPSFAIDLINAKPLGLVAGAVSEADARLAADIFASPTVKVYLSTDPLGVELGGIVKNIIALAAGVSDGLGFGDSARSGLITRGLAEMTRLASALGADARTLSGLSGLGDLVMTASCDNSRNRTVGLRLGQGEKLSDIIKSLGSVAEGVTSTPLVLRLAEKHKIEMPITNQVANLLSGAISLSEVSQALLTRPTKREF